MCIDCQMDHSKIDHHHQSNYHVCEDYKIYKGRLIINKPESRVLNTVQYNSSSIYFDPIPPPAVLSSKSNQITKEEAAESIVVFLEKYPGTVHLGTQNDTFSLWSTRYSISFI